MQLPVRAIVILLRLLPLLSSFRRDRARWLVAGSPLQRTPAFHARRAETLARTIAGLGPTFIKLAQLFAGRADIIPSPYVEAMGTLIDRVPAVPWRRIRAELERAYGTPPERMFQHIDPAPLAAASLGQVHRARIEDRDVVVKVLRPGAAETVHRDIAAARIILEWIAPRLNPPHVAGLRSVLDEFERRVGDELDFRIEAKYARQIRRNFAGNASVRIPDVLDAWVRETALVLEFVDGTRIDRVQPSTETTQRILSTVMELYVQMMLIDGLFHADPHPGNLMVDAEGRVVLLDFGMVVDVPVETRRTLVKTVFSAIRGDIRGTVDGFYGLGLVTPDADRATIETLATQLIALSTERTTAKERVDRVIKLADEVLATLYDFPILLPGDMVYFARTAALIEGLGVRWDAQFNAVAFATPLVLRMRSRIVASLGGMQVVSGLVDWPVLVGETLGMAVATVRGAFRRALASLRQDAAHWSRGRTDVAPDVSATQIHAPSSYVAS
jgi:predicted unusual protein kinase regulating ubiquinone biosynthesis (AarF/ABC1/UbiB family)